MKSDKVAVFLHLYHTDLAKTFLGELSPIKDLVDVYITLPDSKDCEEAKSLLKPLNPSFEYVPNLGTDIMPFLKLLNKYGKNYKYFLKMHSKKSLRDNHANWLNIFLHELIGDRDNFKKNIKLMEDYDLIGPPSCIMDNENIHTTWIDYLMHEIKMPNDHRNAFIAGTMFMGRSDTYLKYFDKNVAQWLESLMIKRGEVGHVKDWDHPRQIEIHSYVHSIERMFGYVGELGITEPFTYKLEVDNGPQTLTRNIVITKYKDIYDTFHSYVYGIITGRQDDTIEVVWYHKRPKLKKIYTLDHENRLMVEK